MSKTIKRKEFTKIFLPFNRSGTQIWVITRIKELPEAIIKMAVKLAKLDFINYVRMCDETLSASSHNYPKRPKIPITQIDHETATGIQIIYSVEYKYIDFFEINSPFKGNGSKMVDAILKDFPCDWSPTVVMDWSNGFWEKMEEKYKELEWTK